MEGTKTEEETELVRDRQIGSVAHQELCCFDPTQDL